MADRSEAAQAVAEAFDKQIGWCRGLGSPLTAAVLAAARADLRPGGRVAALLGEWPGDPVADAVPLRLAGGLHALVLSGQVPALAACYRAEPAAGSLPEALQAALAEHEAFLREFVRSPPQTNEVGRSAVLLGGFLHIAATAGPRLRLLEIGASAGLNLMWDRYRYELGGAAWGDQASPVLLAPEWSGPLPKLDTPVAVVSRAGCDQAPVDLADPAQVLRLSAYVWPDQPQRLARLAGAVAVARAAGVQVAPADAGTWVPAQLATLTEGATTVLFHSVMWQYMPAATRQAVAAAIAAAGARASTAAPLAWLRFEPAGGGFELAVTLWPGGETRVLATAHAHGSAVVWRA